MRPSYLELISPSEKDKEKLVVPDSSLVEKYSETKPENPVTTTSENLEVKKQTYTVAGKNYVAEISNTGGVSIVSFRLSKHLKKSEDSLNLIDDYNTKNLVVSFVNQSGEVVDLDKNWGVVSGESVELSDLKPEASFIFTTEHLGRAVTKKLVFCSKLINSIKSKGQLTL